MTEAVVVFDLETQKSADEVGGWGNSHLLKLSVGCIYDYGTSQYVCFTEKEVEALIDLLFSARCVVGFNVKGFDYKVLKPYSLRSFDSLPTLDILEEVKKELGFRLSLNSLSEATLSEDGKKAGKSAGGLQAIEWFKTGQIEKIKEYCTQDVKLTRELYEYGKTYGCLYYWDAKKGERCKVRASWLKQA